MTASARGEFRLQSGEQLAGQLCIQAVARFAVNADDLLLVRHDARLDAGMPRGIFHEAGAADILPGQKFLQFPAGIVIANRAEKFRGHIKRSQIARDIGRAAGHEALALEIHDRHRRFRRNARHAAPDELVQHHVADDEHAGFCAAARICRARETDKVFAFINFKTAE